MDGVHVQNERLAMGIQDISDNTVFVELPQEPQKGSDIEDVIELISNRDDCDVILDFSNVEIITSSNLTEFLTLNKILTDRGHRLILSAVKLSIKAIFIVTGIDEAFEFTDDASIAMASL